MIRMRDDIPEEDMPPRRRFVRVPPPCPHAPATRPPRGQYDFVDTVEAGQGLICSLGYDARTVARAADRVEDVGYVRALQASKHRMMTSIKEVNLRVSYQAQVRRQESEDFYTQLHDARTDRIDIRLEIDVVRGQRTAYEIELHEVRQAYLISEAQNRALLARLETLETHMSRIEWQRQRAEDDAVRQMMCIHVLEARAQIDTVEDTGSCCIVGLSQWLKKMKSVFHISGCAINNQVKFATYTLLGAALTWWNDHVRTLGHDAAYAMTWGTLKKKLTDKYCPKGKIKKLEIELWNLRVRGNDVAAYTQRFQELALMCTKFLADETKKVDKYISGLPDNIHRNVISARPKTLDDAIELANDLMDQKIRTYAERHNDNKRKADDSSRNNQQPHKKQNVARAYTAGPGEKKAYTGTLPLCTKCNYHHTRQCVPKCRNCKRKNCPKLKNGRNSNGNGTAQGRAYALGGRDASPDSKVITELADGKIIGVNTIICGYTLNFMNHPFNIDLIPVRLGSFDIIIGMDWLTKYHGVIIGDEKIIHVPFGREMPIFQGNGNNQREESRLNIISCTKAQEYLSKGCDVFLAHITTKEAKDKSEGKRLEDVPIVRDFPEDLPGIPPARQVEFQIYLVPGDALVARAPYRLVSSEMKELAEQL
ncbi:putative reverse transcriptase domain-containing protein [Tanacetum coccineum]